MVEMQGFVILTKAQVRELLAEVETQIDWVAKEAEMAGFKRGYQAAEAESKDANTNANDAYDQVYE